MGFSFDILAAEEGLKDFRRELERINPDDITRETARDFAEKVRDVVTATIKAEGKITSPAMNSQYNRGPGPSMVQDAAWIITQEGTDSFSIEPHPSVRQRAYVLNYGYPGRITPNSAEVLKFEVNGEPFYRESVEGPDRTLYWEHAMKIVEDSGNLENIGRYNMIAEFEEVF